LNFFGPFFTSFLHNIDVMQNKFSYLTLGDQTFKLTTF
jgi:hypothetical protein